MTAAVSMQVAGESFYFNGVENAHQENTKSVYRAKNKNKNRAFAGERDLLTVVGELSDIVSATMTVCQRHNVALRRRSIEIVVVNRSIPTNIHRTR
jgi:hypothetical protein